MAKVTARQRGGKWSYRFEKAKVDGKRQFVEKGGFLSEESAIKAGIKAQAAYESGNASERPASMSFADFLDLWYERTRLSCRNNTLEMREKNIRLHIKPALGSYRLESLTPALIDDFVKAKRKAGYSFETVDRILNNVKTALDYAMWPMEMLRDNPARLIKVPGKEFAPLSRRQPRRRLEDDELRQIFALHPFGTTYHMPILLGLYLATRAGETLGLSWDDVDMEHHTIRIHAQIQRLAMRGKHSFEYMCEVKTESSRRTLVYDDALAETLERWHRQQAAYEMEYGGDYCYNYLVPAKDYQGRDILRIVSLEKAYPAPGRRVHIICTQPNGRYIYGGSLAYQCKKIREHGVKDFDFHCLRHTNLTMLGESQVSASSIMARAGHSEYTTTSKYYIDNRLEMQRAPVAVLSEKLKGIL